MNGFEAYKIFSAVRLHFTTDYDFFKYNGKVSCSPEAFNLRKDKYLFHKIAKYTLVDKHIKDWDIPYFFAVNFFNSRDQWVRAFIQPKAKDLFLTWKFHQGTRLKNFQSDLDKISKNFRHLIISDNGQYPELLNMVFRKEIEEDTLLILDKYMHFLDSWNNKIGDDFVWGVFRDRMIKFRPFFFSYDFYKDPNIWVGEKTFVKMMKNSFTIREK